MARRSSGGNQTIGKSLRQLFTELAFIAVILSIVYFVVQIFEIQTVQQYLVLSNSTYLLPIDTPVTNASITVSNGTQSAFGNLSAVVAHHLMNSTHNFPTQTGTGNSVEANFTYNATHYLIYTNETYPSTAWSLSYSYRHIDNTEPAELAGIKSGFTIGKAVVTLGLGLLGLVMVVLVFAGYLIPVIQSMF